MKSSRIIPSSPKSASRHRRVASRRGSVFIEFAFVVPILAALALGVIQYGMIAQSTEVVTNLSREGARFATLGASQKDNAIVTRIKSAAENTSVNPNDLSIEISPPDTNTAGRTKGSQLTIRVTYNLRKKVFLPATSYMLEQYKQPSSPDPFYTATAIMRIL